MEMGQERLLHSHDSSSVTYYLQQSLTGTRQTANLIKHWHKRQMAEETLALEIDRVERLEGMNKISVNTYPSYTFGVNILTTT
jgi:hypothetical protein